MRPRIILSTFLAMHDKVDNPAVSAWAGYSRGADHAHGFPILIYKINL
jgi:hypothetical protein